MKSDYKIRQQLEEREHLFLSQYATFSDCSKGRARKETPCDIRPAFQRDRDRIIHSKAFRRLKDKTQVFLTPEGDHYRTRLTHTLEVSQIARSISRSLKLNEDLTEAIALGHDLGHTPFGHAGERALNRACSMGFQHHLQSVRVVEFLEKHGKGLNLSFEVLDGIKNHQTVGNPSTLEGKVVQMSDKIAYVNHDIDDAIRGGIIKESDIPSELTGIVGHNLGDRLNSAIHNIIMNSLNKDYVAMTDEYREAMSGLRKWMFENVYTNPVAKGEEHKAESMIVQLFEYYMEHPDMVPMEYHEYREERGESMEQAICDYIAGMTDKYFVSTYTEIMIPKAWKY
ncbi:MAG: deoxyguanosinetriphosphate triphosphohydrolase [Lachnospiraceae bacterium]|nr:deoxyguanosinetriphosphate triphosphohydrolase [Lachnospiraceae bacterium]